MILRQKKIKMKFRNDRFHCKCLHGQCPNYDEECGKGGQVVDPELGYDITVAELIRSYKMDHTFGRDYQTKKNKRSREKRKLDKENDK